MKMFTWSLIGLLLTTGAGGAGELEDKLSSLRSNFESLEGYWAMYEAKTETGRSATFEQGADFASGWAFVRMELRDADGNLMTANEQWSTKDGDYVIRNDGEVIVLTGLQEIVKRSDQLRKLLMKKGKITPFRIVPNCYLTETGVSSEVGFSTAGRDWFTGIRHLIRADEKEITLDWGQHGTIIVDPSSGLLISQVIDLEKGTREMKRTDWQRNPGAKMIASRMNINLKGAKKSALVELGMGRKLLGIILQGLIREIGKNPETGKDLEKFLGEREGAVAEYLGHEILKGAPFLKEEFLFKMIENFAIETQKNLKRNGQDLSLEHLFQAPGYQAQFVTKLAEFLLKKSAGLNREKYLQDALAGVLIAEGETETMAKTIIENTVERAYYQAKIRRTLDAYLKQEWGE